LPQGDVYCKSRDLNSVRSDIANQNIVRRVSDIRFGINFKVIKLARVKDRVDQEEQYTNIMTDQTITATSLMKRSPSKVEPTFTAPYGDNIHISKHPVLSHKLSILRSSSTTPSVFRSVLREITFHLGYEATSTLLTRDIPITVPAASNSNVAMSTNGLGSSDDHHIESTGQKLSQKLALIPILRSGLGMVDSMLELVDNATVHHIGMYRSKHSLMPVQYYNRLPKVCDVDVAYVLDVCIAGGNTIISVVGILKKVCYFFIFIVHKF